MKSSSFIKEAFYILCTSKKPKEISVNTIIKKAGVNRSTFYYYYKNKEDLVDQLQNEVLHTFFNILQFEDRNRELILKNFGHYDSPQVYACCHYVQLNQHIFHIWFNDIDFVDKFSERLINYSKTFSNNETHCIYASYGAIGYFKHWIQSNCSESYFKVAKAILDLFKHAFTLDKNLTK